MNFDMKNSFYFAVFSMVLFVGGYVTLVTLMFFLDVPRPMSAVSMYVLMPIACLAAVNLMLESNEGASFLPLLLLILGQGITTLVPESGSLSELSWVDVIKFAIQSVLIILALAMTVVASFIELKRRKDFRRN